METSLHNEEFLQKIIDQLQTITSDKWQYKLSYDGRLLSFIQIVKLNHTYTYSWMVEELDLARSDTEIIQIICRKIGTQERDPTKAEKVMGELLK